MSQRKSVLVNGVVAGEVVAAGDPAADRGHHPCGLRQPRTKEVEDRARYARETI